MGHLVVLSSGNQARGSSLETAVFNLVAPVAQGVRVTSTGISRFFDSLRLVGSLQEENRELQEKVEVMRQQLVRLSGVEEEFERLARLSRYKRFETGKFFVADVVYIDSKSWFRTLILYTGENQARLNQPVVTERGLVGRTVVVSGSYAKVLLLTDGAAYASAMIKTTRRRGLAHGKGNRLLLENIPLLEKVVPGDQVVTAGIDGVFPRGIPIGTVRDVKPGPRLFHIIELEPAIDIDQLDQVYVLTEETLPQRIRDAVSGGGP
jgi:rod shape-determining protein MreC